MEKGRIFGALFSKKVPFFANIERCHKFIEMFWLGAFPDKVTPDIDFIDEVVNQCYVTVVKIVL